MPTIPSDVLVHRARIVRVQRAGAKDVQGEPAITLPQEGGWFPARIMVQRPSKDQADPGGRRRDAVRWTLLYGDEFESGAELTPSLMPRDADMVDVQQQDTDPVIRYTASNARYLDDGGGPFGGEVDLVVIGDVS
jgi:hypothetical protein